MKLNRTRVAALALAVTLLIVRQADFSAAAAPAPAAGATAPVCGGRDLLAEMQQSEPERFAAVRASEQATENGGAILWKIETPGAAPSYLLGTMHTSDERLTRLSPAAIEALSASRKIALELAEIVDEERFNAETVKNIKHIAFFDGRNLETILTPQQVATVADALATFQVPFAAMRMMKPWFVSVAMALPLCELERKKAGFEALDVTLGHKAREMGLDVVGLETVDEQFAAFDRLSIDDQKRLLLSAVKLLPILPDQVETMTRLYAAHRIGALWEFSRQMTIKYAAPGDEAAELAALARFREALLVARNQVMSRRAQPLVEAGGAFIAVGALHLPGEEGVVALLRKAGYKVTPAD